MRVRLLVAVAFVLAAGVASRAIGHGDPVTLLQPFSLFPVVLEEWKGRSLRLTDEVAKRVGVTDYLYRIYVRNQRDVVDFYVGYYESQRHGEMVHSPKNCLPGSGWYVAKRDRTILDVGNGIRLTVNKFIVENGIEQRLVLYWYQQAGARIVTNEYVGRVQLVWDAVTRNRTDAALIRVTVPFEGDSDRALRIATEFLRDAYPRLTLFLPFEVKIAS